MARSMLSFGMLLALASAMAARSRGLPFGSPPPIRAATVISFRMRVKILPRFASAAPFLCLMVLHLLWPDIAGCSSCWSWKETGWRHASQKRGADYSREVRGTRYEVRGSRYEVRGSRFEVRGSRFEVRG